MKAIRIYGALVLLILSSCSKTQLVNDLEEDTRIGDYYTDEYGNEGIVVFKSDIRCIVLSLDETELAWSNENELVYDLTIYGDDETETHKFGLDMLNIMCSNGISKYPAQEWCNMKNHGKFATVGSWRLPSFKEWYVIFHNNFDVDNKLRSLNSYIKYYGGKKLNKDSYYWTCTEDLDGVWEFSDTTLNIYDPADRAINVSPFMMSSTNKDDWAKQNVRKVRAIKYIYYEKDLY